jgi:hypothetical protein
MLLVDEGLPTEEREAVEATLDVLLFGAGTEITLEDATLEVEEPGLCDAVERRGCPLPALPSVGDGG